MPCPAWLHAAPLKQCLGNGFFGKKHAYKLLEQIISQGRMPRNDIQELRTRISKLEKDVEQIRKSLEALVGTDVIEWEFHASGFYHLTFGYFDYNMLDIKFSNSPPQYGGKGQTGTFYGHLCKEGALMGKRKIRGIYLNRGRELRLRFELDKELSTLSLGLIQKVDFMIKLSEFDGYRYKGWLTAYNGRKIIRSGTGKGNHRFQCFIEDVTKEKLKDSDQDSWFNVSINVLQAILGKPF